MIRRRRDHSILMLAILAVFAALVWACVSKSEPTVHAAPRPKPVATATPHVRIVHLTPDECRDQHHGRTLGVDQSPGVTTWICTDFTALSIVWKDAF
jgi:hypothetical protein